MFNILHKIHTKYSCEIITKFIFAYSKIFLVNDIKHLRDLYLHKILCIRLSSTHFAYDIRRSMQLKKFKERKENEKTNQQKESRSKQQRS